MVPGFVGSAARGDDTSRMPTWGEARAAATTRLRSAPNPDTAGLDADVLLAYVLGVGKEALFAHPERELSAADDRRFQALVERRGRGEPVAYLRGFKEFYGLRFLVDPRVLIPRPETEALVDAAREFIAGRALTVVDVGTGSGAIAVAIAAYEQTIRVIATDSSRDALSVAETIETHAELSRIHLAPAAVIVNRMVAATLSASDIAALRNRRVPRIRKKNLDHLAEIAESELRRVAEARKALATIRTATAAPLIEIAEHRSLAGIELVDSVAADLARDSEIELPEMHTQ